VGYSSPGKEVRRTGGPSSGWTCSASCRRWATTW